MSLERLRPQLTLDTAVPDPLPVAIVVDGERQIYELRDVGDYSIRERKRLSSLLQGIIDFEVADEDNITDDDVLVYQQAMREVMYIAMPKVPRDVVDRLSLQEHGRLCGFIVKLFNQGKETPDLPTTETLSPNPEGPRRLRRLAERLTWAKTSPDSPDSMAAPPQTG